VTSLDVVEGLDVVGDGAPRRVVGSVLLVVDEFGSEGSEEALRDGVDAPIFVKQLSSTSAPTRSWASARSIF
jgi:hypothetical protein